MKEQSTGPEPERECDLCPRLVDFRGDHKTMHPDWFNGAVPSFGCDQARLLIVGLAPGLRGANKTGRPFTGDYAGKLLYASLLKFGLAQGEYAARADDGLRLRDCMITNAVRCVPPQNKPTAAEIKTCQGFLARRIGALPRLRVIIALGRIAHDSVLGALAHKKSAFKFGHNTRHELGSNLSLIDSYHCSRYNTNTGRLNERMFHDVFRAAKGLLN